MGSNPSRPESVQIVASTQARNANITIAAMPTASSAYILASRMGGDAAFVAMLVTISMFGALAALPLWMQVLR